MEHKGQYTIGQHPDGTLWVSLGVIPQWVQPDMHADFYMAVNVESAAVPIRRLMIHQRMKHTLPAVPASKVRWAQNSQHLLPGWGPRTIRAIEDLINMQDQRPETVDEFINRTVAERGLKELDDQINQGKAIGEAMVQHTDNMIAKAVHDADPMHMQVGNITFSGNEEQYYARGITRNPAYAMATLPPFKRTPLNTSILMVDYEVPEVVRLAAWVQTGLAQPESYSMEIALDTPEKRQKVWRLGWVAVTLVHLPPQDHKLSVAEFWEIVEVKLKHEHPPKKSSDGGVWDIAKALEELCREKPLLAIQLTITMSGWEVEYNKTGYQVDWQEVDQIEHENIPYEDWYNKLCAAVGISDPDPMGKLVLELKPMESIAVKYHTSMDMFAIRTLGAFTQSLVMIREELSL